MEMLLLMNQIHGLCEGEQVTVHVRDPEWDRGGVTSLYMESHPERDWAHGADGQDSPI